VLGTNYFFPSLFLQKIKVSPQFDRGMSSHQGKPDERILKNTMHNAPKHQSTKSCPTEYIVTDDDARQYIRHCAVAALFLVAGDVLFIAFLNDSQNRIDLNSAPCKAQRFTSQIQTLYS